MRMGWRREAPRKLRFLKVGFPQAHTGWGLTGNFFRRNYENGNWRPGHFRLLQEEFCAGVSKQISWYP